MTFISGTFVRDTSTTIHKINLKITCLKLNWNLPGDKELTCHLPSLSPFCLFPNYLVVLCLLHVETADQEDCMSNWWFTFMTLQLASNLQPLVYIKWQLYPYIGAMSSVNRVFWGPSYVGLWHSLCWWAEPLSQQPVPNFFSFHNLTQLKRLYYK